MVGSRGDEEERTWPGSVTSYHDSCLIFWLRALFVHNVVRSLDHLILNFGMVWL